MRLFQAPLDTPLDSPFFANLSVHGLHFTVYAPSNLASGEILRGHLPASPFVSVGLHAAQLEADLMRRSSLLKLGHLLTCLNMQSHVLCPLLSDPTEIPPPYRETGAAIPLSHCTSCGIADYRCYTPTSFLKNSLSQSKGRPNKGGIAEKACL